MFNYDVDLDYHVDSIQEETGVARDTIERILLWELEIQDRQYLAPENYIDFMSDDLADLLELPCDLVARVLEAEQESVEFFEDKENILSIRIG